MKNSTLVYLALLACSLICGNTAQACTGIRLTAENGTVVCARTLEFGIDQLDRASAGF